MWQIVHEIKGRLRLKGPLKTLEVQQLLIPVIDKLQAIEGVKITGFSLRTQTILLHYNTEQQRSFILSTMPASAQAITSSTLTCLPSVKKLAAVLAKAVNLLCYGLSRKILPGNRKPYNPITGQLLRKLCLPPVLRYSWSALSAIPYILEGMATLISKRKLTVPVLDASALLSAFLQRDFASLGTITFLFALSNYLEDFTHKKSRHDLAVSLKMLENKECWLLKDNMEVKISLALVEPGDLLILRDGDEIPVDGTVVEGEAMVNQASMTGESMPQHRTIGAWLHAGTAIEEGRVVLKAVNVHGETKISRIIEFIDQAEELKAGVQMQAEKQADALVPFSFAGAALVGLVSGNPRKATSVLMVDYSCAIRLSTPLSILSAMRSGVNKGLLIKGGKFLEALAQADTLVFDKTGTLTKATPQVADIIPFSSYDHKEILRLAACLEEHFPHPLGRAVVAYAEKLQLKHREEHAEVEYIAAHGIASRLDNKKVLLGSQHFLMEDEGIAPSEAMLQQMNIQAAQGRSLLYLAIENRIVGMLAISDPPRDEAAQIIELLQQENLQVHMLTGDSRETAQAVARELGIKQYCAQMLPADKAAYLQQLKDSGHKVMMVGDGINDSPALALADVGITLQDGSDLARNVADVVLTRNNLADLLNARKLGKRTMRRIRHNYFGIISINSLLLLLGIGGVITPASSALLHNASTILSALNSMRPYRLK